MRPGSPPSAGVCWIAARYAIPGQYFLGSRRTQPARQAHEADYDYRRVVATRGSTSSNSRTVHHFRADEISDRASVGEKRGPDHSVESASSNTPKCESSYVKRHSEIFDAQHQSNISQVAGSPSGAGRCRVSIWDGNKYSSRGDVNGDYSDRHLRKVDLDLATEQ